MYKVAICDDDSLQVSNLETHISEYFDEINVQYEIDGYYKGDRMVNTMSGQIDNYHLIFLDIEMEGLNGIETAKLLRNIDKNFIAMRELNIKNFGTKTSEEWARFVRNNRNKKNENYSDIECNLDNKYDIVIGPIADDDMALLFRQYENGMITFDTMLNGMIYKETTNQYSFHTERAISLLKKERN